MILFDGNCGMGRTKETQRELLSNLMPRRQSNGGFRCIVSPPIVIAVKWERNMSRQWIGKGWNPSRHSSVHHFFPYLLKWTVMTIAASRFSYYILDRCWWCFVEPSHDQSIFYPFLAEFHDWHPDWTTFPSVQPNWPRAPFILASFDTLFKSILLDSIFNDIRPCCSTLSIRLSVSCRV